VSRQIKKGSTDISVILRAIDSTTGLPKTDFAYNTAGIDLWYRRNGSTVTSITEATLAAVDSAHSDGGVIHIGNGYFRLDSPDAAFATGANSVFFGGTATGVIIIGTELQLVNHDVEDGVRLGLTALPAAAADAAGGLPISDAGALDLDTLLATLTNGTYGLSAIETLVDDLESRLTATRAGYLDNLSAGAVALASGVTVTTNNDKTGYTASTVSDKTGYSLSVTPPSASDIATAVWAAGTRTLSSFGTLVADVATAVWGAVARTITGGTITTNSDKTGYTVSTVSDKTGYSLTVTPPTAEQIRSEIDSNSTRLADINGATDKLDTAMELDGAVYRFTTNALEQAPSGGGGGDATAANQTIIINHLTDVKGATFSGATDSLEAIRNRGDVAWITGGTGGGSNAVTINVKDDSAVNVVDCYVEVWDSAGTSFISRTNTNSSGNVTFNLDSNTYTVKMHKTGYYFANQTLIVDGVESVAYTGTILVPSAPADPEMCRVYGFFLNPDGTIITGLTGNALVTCYQEDNTVYAGTEAGTYVTTGTYAGMMYFDIARGATATVTLEAISYSKTFTVPELDTEELKDL
jgi:hypothetical protein